MIIIFSKKAWAWYLYDFANSLLIINGAVYFTQWVVVDNKAPDAWLSIGYASATLVLFLSAPFLGVILDRQGTRFSFLFWTTIATALAGVLIQIFGLSIDDWFGRIVTALVFYGCLNLFFQLSLFVYNTYLKDLGPPTYGGRMSGIGFGFSNLGSIAGLLLNA